MNDSREAITKVRTAHSYPYVNSQPNSQPNGLVRHLLVCVLMLVFGTVGTDRGALFAEDQQLYSSNRTGRLPHVHQANPGSPLLCLPRSVETGGGASARYC